MKILSLSYFILLGALSFYLFQEKTKAQSIKAGAEIYQDFCVQCHLANGEGVSGVFPPLRASDYLLNNIDLSIAGIKFGLKGKIVVNDEEYDGVMINQGLDEEEIADVMNYILNHWDNSSEAFITKERVEQIQKSILQ
ncbi:MAG: cytochrome c [Flavobacteriaceae bacterium]|nr:cytochrome c [Flavobacteriaceae bacterium]MDG1911780.1 cytochrome c [Flavobacteriaceae bacterium]